MRLEETNGEDDVGAIEGSETERGREKGEGGTEGDEGDSEEVEEVEEAEDLGRERFLFLRAGRPRKEGKNRRETERTVKIMVGVFSS